METFNTDGVLVWRLSLEYYCIDIEYIKYDKYIVADSLSRFPVNKKQEITLKSIYKKINRVRN